MKAHIIRRLIHLATLLIPLAYYYYFNFIPKTLNISANILLFIIFLILVIFEILRLKFGWIVFGQREYERRQISAFIWGMLGILLVLLLAPGPQFGIPIISAYAIGDPLIGELRRLGLATVWVIILSILAIGLIWLICSLWLIIPWWLILIIAPITVAAEWPSWKWIDDNAMMQLIPLVIILILHSL